MVPPSNGCVSVSASQAVTAKGELIAASIRGLATQLLGGGVRGGAENRAGSRQGHPEGAALAVGLALPPFPREPEVDDSGGAHRHRRRRSGV